MIYFRLRQDETGKIIARYCYGVKIVVQEF